MRIAIAPGVAENGRWFPILDILAMLVEDQRHTFDAAESIELINSSWARTRPADTSDIIRLSSLERSTDGLSDKSLVVVDENCRMGGVTHFDRNTTILHPMDAVVFLTTPFQVILENEVFDGAFLLWMAKALGFVRFLEAYRANKFAFRHAGGKDSIERSARTFLHGVWTRRDERYSRAMQLWMCVILDSDARHEADFPNRYIIEATVPLVTFVHQLKKRSIESYIPIDFLYEIGSRFIRKSQIYALNRLNAEQRTYFHMKKGFRFERNESPTLAEYRASPKISEAEKKLFSTIPQQDWHQLRQGFGGYLSAVYLDERLRPNTNDKRLIDAADKSELLSLLKRIYERL